MRGLTLRIADILSLVHLMMWDHMGPASDSSKSSHNDADYRTDALKYYYPDLMDQGTPQKLPCMLLGDLDAKEIVAGHIYQIQWSRAVRVGGSSG